MTIYIVIGKDTRDNAIHLHRAFDRYAPAAENVDELNEQCLKLRLPRVYYMYIMVLETVE